MKELFHQLKNYGFTKPEKIKTQLDKLSENELSRFLESYLELAKKRPLIIPASIGATDIYPDSWGSSLPLKLIKQLAIYANKIYIHDPLIELANDWQYLDFMPNYVLEYHSREERVAVFKMNLALKIKEIIDLEPLAQSKIIHLAPTELIQQKKPPTQSYADDFYGPNGSLEETRKKLPSEFEKYCEQFLRVSSVKLENGQQVIYKSETPFPVNTIAIQFVGDPWPMFYYFFNIITPEDTDEEDRTIQMYFDTSGKETVDPKTFYHWVEGSKYKVAIERFKHLEKDLLLANLARAKFITSFPASKDLAQLNLSSKTNHKGIDISTALLRINLPFFENVKLFDIIKARKNEIAFEEFRSAMNKAFKEIDALPSSPEFQKHVDEVYRDLLILPVTKIDQQMKSLKHNFFIDAAIFVGSLVSTIVTKGDTLISAAALYATTESLKMYKSGKNEMNKIKQLPSFFYWELTKKSR